MACNAVRFVVLLTSRAGRVALFAHEARRVVVGIAVFASLQALALASYLIYEEVFVGRRAVIPARKAVGAVSI